MDIEQVNQVLTRAIVEFQDAEIEGLLEASKKKKQARDEKGRWLKKIIGRAPDMINPLDRGEGIKGFIGRMKEPM
jgi:hypothetical protein